jgi:hypothetical protein
MLQVVADRLYATSPSSILYHYTSLQGLLGIVRTKKLWASDIHYLNDAQELKNFSNYIAIQVLKRKEQNEIGVHILEQFRDWLVDRTSYGPMMFVGSFTENGNLLSQWRGYCPYGKGVSIGFEATLLSAEASRASFAIGRCLYDIQDHERLAVQVVDHIAATSKHYEVPKDAVEHQSHYALFLSLEPLLLRIAALVKHPSFKEEAEWRLVSPVLNNYVEPPIAYREGPSSLVPYLEIPLPINSNGALRIRRTIVGPSPNPNLSIEAVSRFLSKEKVAPNEVWSSAIPYRQA